MTPNKMLVLTSLAAGAMVACGSAFGDKSVSSMTTNATTHVSNMFKGSSSSMVDKMSEKLGLTDAQKGKVESVFNSEHQQMRDVHQNASLTTDEKQSKIGEIRDDLDSKMKGILTPEQYTKWQNLTHEHHTMPAVTPNSSGSSPP